MNKRLLGFSLLLGLCIPLLVAQYGGNLWRWINQDVTIGASPALDGANLTGVDADDVDLVTVPSGVCTGDTTADGCMSTLDTEAVSYTDITDTYLATRSGAGWTGTDPASLGDLFIWTADLSSAGYDWKAEGTGSTDPTSTFTVISADLASFAFLEVGSNVITWDVSASGGGKHATLRAPLVGLPDLYLASEIYIEMDFDLNDDATNFDTADDQFRVFVENNEVDGWSSSDEEISGTISSTGGGNIGVRVIRETNNANANSGFTNMGGTPKNPARLQVSDSPGLQYAQFYEKAIHGVTQENLAVTVQHCRTGTDSTPYLRFWFYASNGGRSAGTISNIKVTIR